ncbi:ABC transporter permease [Pseudomonas quasicaspiana]|uniref:ABC transporter permease n=1 Tax=Pseudomonas quasicaspiana TaxID=2829821 RepID=UPI001E3F7B0E|nr:ABC transporter permease [Pseudomonas quasicaspiana]MCD5970652.1 ABC transporter permease [Pseudomonas quasicaspiana]
MNRPVISEGPTDRLVIQPNTGSSSLKERLNQAERRNKLKSVLLVVPLLAFIAVFFLMPIGDMLVRIVQNGTLAHYMPQSAVELKRWDRAAVPEEKTFSIVGKEILDLLKAQDLDRVGTDLNRVQSGMKLLLNKTARGLEKQSAAGISEFKPAMISIDKRWGETSTWSQLKVMAPSVSAVHYLAALDMQYDDNGEVVSQPENRQIYVDNLIKTLLVSAAITLICFILGYPLAYFLASLPDRVSNLLMILVLLPFWTSLLVRTSAWIVILQSNGVFNDVLQGLGLISQPLDLMYNLYGTVIAMTHILLPFMVLPLYSVMKGLDQTYIRAAHSMGASSLRTFCKIYFPLSLPGVSAGGILVFILAVGYYITPALVGGRTGQMISNFIAYHMQTSLNWGLASALASLLLVVVLLMYWVYDRFVGITNMKLG